MSKKKGRSKRRKKSVDPRKQEQHREEVSRELDTGEPRKGKKSTPRGNTPTYSKGER